MSEQVGRIRYGLAVVLSRVQALAFRTSWVFALHMGKSDERPDGKPERRRNSRKCPLCGGPMKTDSRGPRSVEREDGTMETLPEGNLVWLKCVRCLKSQVGIPAEKLGNGYRWAA